MSSKEDRQDRADFTSALRRHVSPDAIPTDAEILSPAQLGERLAQVPRYDLLLLGDVMPGDHVTDRIATHGLDYPFAGILPLLGHARSVIANLEAPFATSPRLPTERYSYRVDPALSECLKRAGISAVNLANNHIMDCGPDGVRQTMEALAHAGIGFFGAGVDARTASEPLILQVRKHRIGFLGYYWNPRCAAAAATPGCAPSDPQLISAAVKSLRSRVDFLVVSFHWGKTYSRQPSDKAQMKARLAIESGADIVMGYHPHVLQPIEWHHGKPIFYSLGNCLMGSGNSKAEGVAIGIRFGDGAPQFDAHLLYVKNRDPRVDYQSKVLTGNAARRAALWLSQVRDGTRLMSVPLK